MMRAIVCIKQVPESADGTVDTENMRLVPSSHVERIVNPFDVFAIEEALQLTEKHGGEVVVLSVGGSEVADALRKALSMGVQQAYLLSDPAFEGSDSMGTARILAAAIRHIGDFDVVLCGKQSIDGAHGQVGPALARMLEIPVLSNVIRVQSVESKGNGEGFSIRAERMLENGRQVAESRLPAVLTVEKDINTPRYPSLMKMRKAMKAEVPVWGAQDMEIGTEAIGAGATLAKVVGLDLPPAREAGEILEGDEISVVSSLVDKLREAKVL